MRRICFESGHATGLRVAPKRKVRCLVCGRLARIVWLSGQLVVGRHYALFVQHTLPFVWEGVF
jgi:hypothetical protein